MERSPSQSSELCFLLASCMFRSSILLQAWGGANCMPTVETEDHDAASAASCGVTADFWVCRLSPMARPRYCDGVMACQVALPQHASFKVRWTTWHWAASTRRSSAARVAVATPRPPLGQSKRRPRLRRVRSLRCRSKLQWIAAQTTVSSGTSVLAACGVTPAGCAGNVGCSGGNSDAVFDMVMAQGGIPSAANYPYVGVNEQCAASVGYVSGATISSYSKILSCWFLSIFN
jgi:hypothetical protein